MSIATVILVIIIIVVVVVVTTTTTITAIVIVVRHSQRDNQPSENIHFPPHITHLTALPC